MEEETCRREGDFVTAARTRTLVQLLYDEYDADSDFEKSKRVARAVGTDWQQALVWLRLILADEQGTRRQLLQLGFDRAVVDAAATLVKRQGRACASTRGAACPDPDALAVAVVALDDEIDKEAVLLRKHAGGLQGGAPCAGARRWRPASPKALPGRGGGRRPSAGGAERRAAGVGRPRRRRAGHDAADAAGAGQRVPGAASSACRRTTGDLRVGHLLDLLQVVGVLVFDVTVREDDDAQEDRAALAQAGTGENPMEATETMALTIAHRLQQFQASRRGDEPENGKAD